MQLYNIYNLINICVDTSNRKYKKYFDNEYKRMQTEASAKAKPVQVVVKIGPLPEKKSGDIVQTRSFKKLFTYKYLIRNLDRDTTEIYFQNHFIDKVYINAVGVYLQAQILEPILYYKLLKKDILFMHAAGVTRGDDGYIMPAYGGTGKTTTSLKLVSRGYKLLGDDLLLVETKKPVVWAYPRPFHIFSYNVASLENASVPLKFRTIIRLKNLLRFVLEKITGEEFLISTRIHAEELYGENIWDDKVVYRKVVFLKKDGQTEVVDLSNKKSLQENAKNIIASADLNDSLYENVLLDERSVKTTKKLEEKVVVNLLKHFDSITYLNTRKMDDALLEKTFGYRRD